MTHADPHVFLVRHGRTPLNAAGRLRGHLDPDLDDIGLTEAYELGRALAYRRPTRILSSPLRRAMQTAQPLAGRTNRKVEIDPRLIDRDFGQWAGHASTEVAKRYGSVDDAPGVESRQAVTSRARAVLDEQLDHGGGGPTVLVTHEAVIQLLLSALAPELGEADGIRQRTGCWNMINRVDDAWQVEQVDQKP